MKRVSIFVNLQAKKGNEQNRLYKSSTGLSRDKFEEILLKFKKYYQPNTERINLKNSEKNIIFKEANEALFFILYHLKVNPIQDILGLNFGISKTSCQNYVEKLKPILKLILKEDNNLPTQIFEDKESFEKAFEGVSDFF